MLEYSVANPSLWVGRMSLFGSLLLGRFIGQTLLKQLMARSGEISFPGPRTFVGPDLWIQHLTLCSCGYVPDKCANMFLTIGIFAVHWVCTLLCEHLLGRREKKQASFGGAKIQLRKRSLVLTCQRLIAYMARAVTVACGSTVATHKHR